MLDLRYDEISSFGGVPRHKVRGFPILPSLQVNAQEPTSQNTPLHAAAQAGQDDLVALLVEAGAVAEGGIPSFRGLGRSSG